MPDSRGHRALKGFQHRVEVPRAIITDAVDEHGRRSSDAIAFAFLDILQNALLRGAVLDVALEAVHVEPELAREVADLRLGYRRLFLIDEVVHLPEAVLLGRGLHGSRDELRSRMGALVGKMAEHIRQAFAHCLTQPRQDMTQPPAVRAQVIAIKNDVHDSVGRVSAAHVIARAVDVALKPERGSRT